MALNERLALGSSGGSATTSGSFSAASAAPQGQALDYQIQYNDPYDYAGTLAGAIRADMGAALQGFQGDVHGAGTLAVQLNIVASNASNAGELADGGPSALLPDGMLDGRTLETPAAIYELKTGSHILGYSNDMIINMPSSALGEIYFDPNPAAGDNISTVAPSKYDAITIFRHELTHGFGFISLRDTSTGTLGSMETEFDHYSSITSTGADYFVGQIAEAVYGAAVSLTTIHNGEQYSHLGNDLNGPLASDLMSGTGIKNGVTHQVSALDLSILRDIGVPESNSFPCFAMGTRISTVKGEVPVEDLRAGDAVLIRDGGFAPVIWIGSRRIDLAHHREPELVSPVLIAQGAIGEAVPAHDLFLSPDHAIWFDGTLIPAKALLNGSTIRQVTPNLVTYFHVELASHAVILAEGAPVESYLDTGNRRMFLPGTVETVIHPEPTDHQQIIREKNGCAPFAETGPVVAALRGIILQRAAIATTGDPDLAISYGGSCLDAELISPGLIEITLPQALGDLVIASRNFVPAEVTADPRDRRRLGVAVSALELQQNDQWQSIQLDDPALLQGWHAPEPGHRWTNGHGVIPSRSFIGARRFRMRFQAATSYHLAA